MIWLLFVPFQTNIWKILATEKSNHKTMKNIKKIHLQIHLANFLSLDINVLHKLAV